MTTSKYPQACFETGLTCESCTEATARELAQACPGLNGKLVNQLFVQIHTYDACSRMRSHFGKAYAKARGFHNQTAGRQLTVAAVA